MENGAFPVYGALRMGCTILKVLRVVMRQCPLVAQYKPEDYLGSHLGMCPRRIEHLLASRGKMVLVRVSCEDCVYAKLVRSAHVIGHPVVRPDGTMQFLVASTRAARRVIREHQDQLLSVEELDARSLYLTQRQREALRMIIAGDAQSLRELGERLGVSKPAASKLVRKSLSKLATRYIGE